MSITQKPVPFAIPGLIQADAQGDAPTWYRDILKQCAQAEEDDIFLENGWDFLFDDAWNEGEEALGIKYCPGHILRVNRDEEYIRVWLINEKKRGLYMTAVATSPAHLDVFLREIVGSDPVPPTPQYSISLPKP